MVPVAQAFGVAEAKIVDVELGHDRSVIARLADIDDLLRNRRRRRRSEMLGEVGGDECRSVRDVTLLIHRNDDALLIDKPHRLARPVHISVSLVSIPDT